MHESEMPEEYYSDEQLIAVAFPFLISENKDIEIQRDDGNMYGIYEQEFLRAVFERYTIFLDNQQMENRLQLALYSSSQ